MLMAALVPYPAHVVSTSQSPTWNLNAILGFKNIVVDDNVYYSPWCTQMLQWKLGSMDSVPSSHSLWKLCWWYKWTSLMIATFKNLDNLPQVVSIGNCTTKKHRTGGEDWAGACNFQELGELDVKSIVQQQGAWSEDEASQINPLIIACIHSK